MLTKFCIIKAKVFPVVMYRCESWTIKKAEHQRTDAFVLWCWRRLLRVPWTARRSNQSILKEISPEYSLEGLMLELKLQYFGHLMRRTDSFVKTVMLGKIQGRRRRGQQRMRWLDGITSFWTWVWTSSESWWWTGRSDVLQSRCAGVIESDTTDWLNWTELIEKKYIHVWKRRSRVWLSVPWIRKLVLGVNWELISYLSRKTANLEWRWEATNKCCWTSWILQDEMIELFSCEVCYTFRQVTHDPKGDSDHQGQFLGFKNENLWLASNTIDCPCLNYWRQGCLTKI